MTIFSSRHTQTARPLQMVVLLSLMLLLASCGTPPTAISPARAAQPTFAVAQSADSLAPNPNTINIRSGNLLVQSGGYDGFQCPAATPFPSLKSINPDFLVLTSNNLTYSPPEIQQMRDYFNHEAGIPSALRWVLGGEIGATSQEASYGSPIACGTTLLVSNTGNTPVQITQVNVQLESAPQLNTHQYRLVNDCSFTQIPSCGQGGGGGAGCATYEVSIQLGSDDKKTTYSGVPFIPDPDCQSLVIAPQSQITLVIDLFPDQHGPQNLIYHVKPSFILYTVRGKQTVPFASITLAFANASQFACYTLQGATTLVKESPAALPANNECL